MPIVSSSIETDVPQADGRRRIVELFIDHLGGSQVVTYLAEAGADTAAALLARIPALEASMMRAEIQGNLRAIQESGRLAVTSRDHSTAAQNFSALREVYRRAGRVEAIMIADFLGTLTDAQLANAFNITAAQVTTLRANKLTPAATLADSIRAASGA